METNTTTTETVKIYECANEKCKWQGTMEEQKEKQISEYLTGHFCPKCGEDEFYRLSQLNIKQIKSL